MWADEELVQEVPAFVRGQRVPAAVPIIPRRVYVSERVEGGGGGWGGVGWGHGAGVNVTDAVASSAGGKRLRAGASGAGEGHAPDDYRQEEGRLPNAYRQVPPGLMRAAYCTRCIRAGAARADECHLRDVGGVGLEPFVVEDPAHLEPEPGIISGDTPHNKQSGGRSNHAVRSLSRA